MTEADIRDTPIRDLVNDLPALVSVKTTDSVKHTLDVLLQGDFRAVGVYDEPGDCFLGLVTVFDIMTWVSLGAYGITEIPTEIKIRQSLDQEIGNIQGIFHEETKRIWSFDEDVPINKVLEPFSKGVHRAIVVRADGTYRMISQIDVVRFGYNNKASFPDLAKTLEDLNLGDPTNSKVISLTTDEIALFGFRKMEMANHSAVPVVDPSTGVIQATLSASDIRGVAPENIHNVLLPVKSFLDSLQTFHEPVTCKSSETLEAVIGRILQNKVHRSWVVDEQNRPVATVSLSDIINRLKGIDEDLQSRSLAVLGRGAFQKLFNSKILISGLNGLGAEVAKNVILANVNTVTLHDTKNATIADLGSHFYLTEADVGSNRAVVSLNKLAELNPSVRVIATPHPLSEELVVRHTVLVLIETSNADAIRWNKFCREHGIYFIKTDVNGLAGTVFNDFGLNFEVVDTNGENPEVAIVKEITPDGRVQCVNDEILNFHENAEISFSEVKGMVELNQGTYRISRLTPYSFFIENQGLDKFSPYISGGIATEVKRSKFIDFRTFEEGLQSIGEYEPTDYSKFDRGFVLHSAYKALDQFISAHGRYPAPGSKSDAEEFIKLFSPLNEASEMPADVDSIKQVLSWFAHGSSLVVNPLAATFGGIVGQEVIKAVTGKFHPINQWLFLDAFEAFPDESLDESEYVAQGSRYDAQIQLLGKTFHQKFANQKYFLVGSGALGCEFLKNFAMTGLGCGPEGKIIVTDDDVIEKSNLSRQFLFRNWHIHKPKSLCASQAAQAMNPDLNVEAKQDRVCTETENIFDHAFWESLSGVCNALDNIKARLYVDSRCIFYEKPLLESGTLGPKCHSQIVIPHKTQHYGAQPDQPEKEAPVCILHNFPHNIQHCLTWGRSEFNGAFEVAPTESKKYLSQPGYIQSMIDAQVSEGDIKEKALLIEETLKSKVSCNTFEDCIRWARETFENSFVNRIKELIFNFPENATTSTGAPFWSPPKRFPQVLSFNAEDPMHLQFIIAGANLRASTFGITRPKNHRKPEFFKQVLADIHLPEFVPTRKKIQTEATESVDDGLNLSDIIKRIPDATVVGDLPLTPEEFEKDNDLNFHMDFIGAAANLRARNYYIEEVDKLKAKLIAGRIIPAIATTTAVATGLVMLEMYKLVNDRPMGDFKTNGAYRNSSINLALPQFQFFEPLGPERISDHVEKRIPDPINHPEYEEEEEVVAYPPDHSIWDKIHVTLPKGFTLQQFVDHFSALGFKVNMITTLAKGGAAAPLVYGPHYANTHSRLSEPYVDVFSRLQGYDISNDRYNFPEVFLLTNDGIDVVTPRIVVHLN